MNTEDFLEQARSVHKLKYDYTKSIYVNSHTKIEIICPQHGSFFQVKGAHIGMKAGCPKCKGQKLRTLHSTGLTGFLKKARQVYGDKWDYSKVYYINNKIPILIGCKKHGMFLKRPDQFLNRKQGCPLCYDESHSLAYVPKKKNSKFLTEEEFFKKAHDYYGDRWNYSKASYVKSTTPIIIICQEHGEFQITPYQHIHGRICPACSKQSRVSKISLSQEDFIRRSIEVHGDFYDYSQAQYKKNIIPVLIGCPNHGPFLQKPSIHISGGGCISCFRESITNTTDEFIAHARKIHGDRYGYDLTNYLGSSSIVEIECKIHGSFYQRARDHTYSKAGCPRCFISKGEAQIQSFLENRGISYTPEFFFSDCKDLRPLFFDVAVTSPFFLIEYDGGQHFFPVTYFGGEATFKSTQRRDQIKNDYCQYHGYHLYRIRYDENILDRMKEILLKENIL